MIKSALMFICYYVPWTVGILIIAGTIHSIISSFTSNDATNDDISEEDEYEE